MTKKEKMIPCCHCGKVINYYDSPFRPFCSERCKLIDFGQWMNETYIVPVDSSMREDDSSEDFKNDEEE